MLPPEREAVGRFRSSNQGNGRERAEAYGVKAREAEKLTVLDSYPLALTDARLADDMDAVAKLKGYSITGPGPRCATT